MSKLTAFHNVPPLTITEVVVAGVLGAYAYLGPKAGREIFNLPSEQADITFGAVTVLTGVFGTITGGTISCCGRDKGKRADVTFGRRHVLTGALSELYSADSTCLTVGRHGFCTPARNHTSLHGSLLHLLWVSTVAGATPSIAHAVYGQQILH